MLTRLCLALIGAFAFMTTVVSDAEARVHGAKASYKANATNAGTYKARVYRAARYKARASKSRVSKSNRSRSRGYASASTSRACLAGSVRAVLGRVEQQFGAVQIVSTCRPGATIAGTGKRSKHASGEAVDFVAPNGKKAEVVRWLIANHKSGGTMTYPMMNHIHIDVGYRFVSLAGRRVRSRA